MLITVCFKEAFNRPRRKRILGITRISFKGYTRSQVHAQGHQSETALRSITATVLTDD